MPLKTLATCEVCGDDFEIVMRSGGRGGGVFFTNDESVELQVNITDAPKVYIEFVCPTCRHSLLKAFLAEQFRLKGEGDARRS